MTARKAVSNVATGSGGRPVSPAIAHGAGAPVACGVAARAEGRARAASHYSRCACRQ